MRHWFMNASVSCKKVYWQAARSLRDKMFTVHFTETIISPPPNLDENVFVAYAGSQTS